MRTVSICCFLLIGIIGIWAAKGNFYGMIVFFSEPKYGGEEFALGPIPVIGDEPDWCQTLPEGFEDRVASIQIQGFSCVQFYSEEQCEGETTYYCDSQPSLGKEFVTPFRRFDFNRNIKSFGRCKSSCSIFGGR